MKTAREWFKELPDDIEKMAVENAEGGDYPVIDFPTFESLPDAIYTSFCWHDSPQGYEFWRNVFLQHCEE